MDINLEKIDTIRERTGISYKEAKEALEKHDGDIIETLIYLEDKNSFSENLSNKGEIIIEKLKETIRMGNVTKIVVKKDGEVIMNIPVTAGAIGAILSPPITAIGLTSALIAKASIEIVKSDGEIIKMNDLAEETMDKMKNAVKRKDNNVDYHKDDNEID